MSRSAVCEGTTRHHRRSPRAHRFTHPVLLALLDHDELDELTGPGGPLDAGRHLPWIRYDRADYLDGDEATPLGEAVRDLVAERTGRRPTGRVETLTQLRTAGFVFNPITVHYCLADGDLADDPVPEVVVLEVTNTPWRERHCYVVDARPGAVAREGTDRDVAVARVDAHGRLHAEFPKALHVSPFMAMDQRYRLTCSGPGPRPTLVLETWTADGAEPTRVLTASLAVDRRPLTARSLRAAAWRRPLAPARAFLAIHGHAALLAAKRVPFVHHPDRTEAATRAGAA